ncbi:MAG: glycosyltransferase family 2 protein [bacterium]
MKNSIRKASIVIRNYNGKDLLSEFLPSVMDAVRFRGDMDEVIIVDDGSTDGSADFVKKEYPSIRLVKIVPNSGNSIIPVNVGVKAAKNDTVICLDNDVKVEKDFITPLLEQFNKDDVFAVCAKIYNPSNEMRIESFNYPRFHRGRLTGHIQEDGISQKAPGHPAEVWYAPGNGAAYDRTKFLELKGLDPIFRPIYCEDVDVCYRAWKRGWRTICEPASVTYHFSHKTTEKNIKADYFKIIRLKNQFILTWKNLQDSRLIIKHIAWTFARLIFSFFNRDFIFLRGLCLASRQIPEVLQKRKRMTGSNILLSDQKLYKRLQPIDLN